MLTPLGRQIRVCRINKGLRLIDMANAFGVKSSFLSAVEHGRKPLPQGWLSRIEEYFSDQAMRSAEWKRLAEESQPKVTIDLVGASPKERELAVAFGRYFQNPTRDASAEIKRLLGDD